MGTTEPMDNEDSNKPPEEGETPANAPPPAMLPWLPIYRLEAVWGAIYGLVLFAAFGTLTAVWDNPLFIRMTPTRVMDWMILGAEAALLGLYLAVQVPGCGIRQASLGGILAFLGFGCALCNKMLVMALGATFLSTYFVPNQPLLGAIGLTVLTLALRNKLRLRASQLAWPESA